MFQPVIKWSGSKRTQANELIKYFPDDIDTYYEPFCGGCSMLRTLIESKKKVNRFVCSDINEDLINLWIRIKENPEEVADYYETLWKELNRDEDKERKKQYFYSVRDRLNKEHNPLDFMFIMRTTTKGMPRYNKQGEFNNSFHISRNGIIPDTLRKIIFDWSNLLNTYKVEFRCCSYEDIVPEKNDFVYLDPPYFNTKGMYYGILDFDVFWNYLRGLSCQYVLSFDGKSGEVDNTYEVPKDCYSKHEYLCSGNSSFRRLLGKSKNSIVYESVYVK